MHPRQLTCFDNELDDTLRGESSQFIAECARTAVNLGELLYFTSTITQASVNDIGRTFCMPECGDAIIAAAEACDIIEEFGPGAEDFFIDICGTNADGDSCYERYTNAKSHVSPIGDCYDTFISTGQCASGCRSELNDAVDDQRCCINVYYDYYSVSSDFDPRELHGGCNVDIPDPCNNTPLTGGSVSHAGTIASMITAVIFYAALS